jgi:hypothetical protein
MQSQLCLADSLRVSWDAPLRRRLQVLRLAGVAEMNRAMYASSKCSMRQAEPGPGKKMDGMVGS